MRDPSLASTASSIPPSSPSSSVHDALDQFLRLQTALRDTFTSLPLHTQAALRRGDSSRSAPILPPSMTVSASTTYLSTRESTRQIMEQALRPPRPYTPLVQRSPTPESRARAFASPSPSWAPSPSSSTSSSSGNRSSSSHGHSYQPPPTPPLHRVYVLRCRSCDTFLSDRGMRAVLLLKPNVILFSTDASPSNAGPMWPEARVDDLPAERTCDCLTSSLGCHGCGSVVGYHIVQPCARCTASVHRHQRSSNHHRYVFHHNEVVYREREFSPGELGVTGARHIPASRSPCPSPTPPSVERMGAVPGAMDGEPKEGGLRAPEPRPREGDTPRPARGASTTLRSGDVLYWHNLVQGGERAMPVDPETRRPRVPQRCGR